VSHSLADGVSFLHLTDRFLRGKIESAPTFPITLDDRLKAELDSPSIDTNRHISDVSRLSNVHWSDTIDPNLPEDVRCEYQFVELPPNAFQCYDSRRNKLIGFTDAVWRSSALACAAMNESQRTFGVSTCVNMRPFINDTSIGNLFVPLCVVADHVSDQTTIEELDKRLRDDFTTKINQKVYLSALKATLNGYQMPSTRTAFPDVSNVGVFKIADPIRDLWVQQTMKSREIEGLVAVLTFGVVTNKDSKIIVRVQTSPTVINHKDAAKTFQAILHSLRYLRPRMTIRDAIQELRNL
jgi:hypothetical protein